MALACLTGGPRDFYFRTDPSGINWGYTMNTSIQPTYGGQVIQLLSVAIDTLTVTVEAGNGGDPYVENLVTFLRDLGEWQKETNEPINFLYATRNINLLVYFKGIQIGKNRGDLAQQMTISFDCASDTNGTVTQIAMGDAMARIHDGMGYEEASDADQAQIDAITADRKKKNTLLHVQGANYNGAGSGNTSDGNVGSDPTGTGKYPGMDSLGAVTENTRKKAQMVMDYCNEQLGRVPSTLWGMGGPPEHSTGRAVDFMVFDDEEMGNKIAEYVWSKRSQWGLAWVIWNQRIRPGNGDAQQSPNGDWRQMEDRGSGTQNHMDHNHVYWINDNFS